MHTVAHEWEISTTIGNFPQDWIPFRPIVDWVGLASSFGKDGILPGLNGPSKSLDGNGDTCIKRTQLLLVEDNFADALLLTTIFAEQKFVCDVHRVPDGQAALDYLFRRKEFTQSHPPDVILLDLNIPKKNGFEVLEELAKDASLHRIPVFILTTSRNEDDKIRAERHSIASYLLKPVDLAGYEELVRLLILTEFPRVTGNCPGGGNTNGTDGAE